MTSGALGPFGRGVAILVGGTFGRQLILLLASPFIARLYSPQAFGQLTLFTSAVSIGSVCCSFAYQQAIPLPRTERQAANLLTLSVGLAVATSSLFASILYYYRSGIARWLGEHSVLAITLALGPTVAFVGAYQAFSLWATRRSRFGLVARTKLSQGLAQDSIHVVGGWLIAGPVPLIVGYAVGQAAGLGTLIRSARVPWRSISVRRVLLSAKRYKRFALYTAPASLINILGLQLPPVLIAHYFGAVTTGYVGLALRSLALPAVVVGQAVAQAFYPLAAARQRENAGLEDFTRRIASCLFVFGVVLFAPVVVAGPSLFARIFGEQWRQAGVYGETIAVWSIFSLLSSPISTMVLVKGRQRAGMWMTVYETTARILSIIVGARYGSSSLAVALFAGVGVAISVVYLVWVLRLAGVRVMRWVSDLAPFGAAALTLIVAGRLLSPFVPVLVLSVLVSGGGVLLAWFGSARRAIGFPFDRQAV